MEEERPTKEEIFLDAWYGPKVEFWIKQGELSLPTRGELTLEENCMTWEGNWALRAEVKGLCRKSLKGPIGAT